MFPPHRCPTSNLLASASSDGTARIWDLQDTGSSGSGRVCMCRHAPQGGAASSVELTCLEWSPDGQALATGASDNAVRLFSREGARAGRLGRRTGSLHCPVDAMLLCAGRRAFVCTARHAVSCGACWPCCALQVCCARCWRGTAAWSWRCAGTSAATCCSQVSCKLELGCWHWAVQRTHRLAA